MCKNKTRRVNVKIPSDLSCTGFDKFQYENIDYCIAPIIHALQQAGIDMRGSCCGHLKYFGDIHLQDDRVLLIIPSSKIAFDDNFQKDMKKLFKKYAKETK